MTDVKYNQERINFLFILVPSAFMIFGLALIVISLFLESDSAQGKLVPALFGLIPLVIGGVMFYLCMKKALQSKREVVDLREKGRQLFGEILDIEEHVTVTHDEHGSHNHYTYGFIVRYSDPDTFQPVVTESVATAQHYTVTNPQCQIRVLDGKVLVEKAYVEKVKQKFSFVPIVFFAVAAVFVIGKSMHWF